MPPVTEEQLTTLNAMAGAGHPAERALLFSGDLYVPAGDGTVTRVDPDGREHPAAGMPARGVTLTQAAASQRALRATLRRLRLS